MGGVARDRGVEREWLESAERAASPSGFADRARRRLEVGERSYGDRWARAGLPRLLGELAEEAADLGASSALAVQALALDVRLDSAARRELRSLLDQVSRAGAAAHAAIVRGEDLCERAPRLVDVSGPGGPARRRAIYRYGGPGDAA